MVALVIASLAVAIAGPGRAGPPGVWVRTGDLLDEIGAPAAALLPSGKVLLVGKPRYSDSTRAEIYDPGGTWNRAADPRPGYYEGVSLTALNDGRVLLIAHAGQNADWAPIAEIYDPATNTWAVTGSMSTSRSLAALVRLGDGRVLVIGGAGPPARRRSAEIYDPATGRWSPTGSMVAAREQHGAVLLNDGRVLVMGGESGGNDAVSDPIFGLNSAELWDPGTGKWSSTDPMSDAKHNFAAVRLEDGRVLVSGGLQFGANRVLSISSTAELYDPRSGTWSTGAPLPEPRADHSATVLPCGVLVTGGFQHVNQGRALASSLLYVPTPGTPGAWATTGPLNEGRAGHAATLLNGGDTLVAGGYDRGLLAVDPQNVDDNDPTRSAERYTPTPCLEAEIPPVVLPPVPPLLGVPTTPGVPPPPGDPRPASGPQILGIHPRSGPVTGGTLVSATGKDLGSVTAVIFDTVRVTKACGGTPGTGTAPCFDQSGQALTVFTPAASGPGQVHIQAENAVGISPQTPADLFEYVSNKAPLTEPVQGRTSASANAGAGTPGGSGFTPGLPGGSPVLNAGASPSGGQAPSPGALGTPAQVSAPSATMVGVPGLAPMPGTSVALPEAGVVREEGKAQAAPESSYSMVAPRPDPAAAFAGRTNAGHRSTQDHASALLFLAGMIVLVSMGCFAGRRIRAGRDPQPAVQLGGGG